MAAGHLGPVLHYLRKVSSGEPEPNDGVLLDRAAETSSPSTASRPTAAGDSAIDTSGPLWDFFASFPSRQRKKRNHVDC